MRKTHTAVAGLLAAAALTGLALHACAPAAPPAPAPAVTEVAPSLQVSVEDILPGEENALIPTDINDTGQVTGKILRGLGGRTGAFRWSRESGLEVLEPLPGASYGVEANAINDAGWVVGWSWYDGRAVATLWKPGAPPQELDVLPGAGNSYAYGINNRGDVVGTSHTRGFLWSAEGGLRDLGPCAEHRGTRPVAVNDAGVVTGTCYDRAFVWTAASGFQFLSGPDGQSANSAPSAINADGAITGHWGGYGVIWVPRDTTGYDVRVLGYSVGPHAINDRRQVAGLSAGGNAAYWDSDGIEHELAAERSEAYGINNLGQIVGVYGPAADRSVIWTVSVTR
jgi:uncharacterized membrane protein